jgi:Flp pilus assembly protein TadB
VLAVAAAAATWWFTDPARGQGSATERSEAIAAWAEMLRDATGTSRGIEGVLVATAQTAPPLIRESVVRFAHRLTYEPLEAALSDLADDLDDPIGDLIVAALTLAASSGGREIRAVLDNLSAAAHDDARMRRRLEVSRQRPRAEMHQVIAVIVCFTLLLIVFVRDYLRPYGTVGGQLVLALAATFWMGGFARMVRLGHIATVPRMLTRKDLS